MNWKGLMGRGLLTFGYTCRGRYVRSVCIWGARDLPLLLDARRPELFINKFYWHFHPAALDCVERKYWERVRREYEGTYRFNYGYYEQLAVVHNHNNC